MSINGISTGYYQTGYTNSKTTKAATGTSFSNQINNIAGKGQIVYLKTDDMLYSGGNGTGLSFYLQYAENSTEDDPIVVAKGIDENGEKFEQTIHINKINPKCATYVEMHALEAHLGVEKRFGYSSLPIGGIGEMGLNDRADFMDLFEKTISDFIKLNEHRAAAYYKYSMQMYGEFMKKQSERSANFVTPLTQEDVYRIWDEKVQANQDKKMTLYEMLSSSYPNAKEMMYSMVGSSKLMTFNEYVREMERQLQRTQ